MRRDAGRALELLAPTSQWRGLAAGCLGAVEFLTGDPEIADRRLADAVEVGTQVGALNAVAAALAFRALIALRHDRWDDAGALIDRSFSVVETGRLHGYPGGSRRPGELDAGGGGHRDGSRQRADRAASRRAG